MGMAMEKHVFFYVLAFLISTILRDEPQLSLMTQTFSRNEIRSPSSSS